MTTMATILNHHTTSFDNGIVDPMLPRTAVITGIQHDTADTATYSLALANPAVAERYRFLPGQFNMLCLSGIGEAAISISSDPGRPEKLLHTIREAGNVTKAIARLRKGDLIGVRGPFGSAWPMEKAEGKDLIFVGGGIGLPPLRPAIYHVARHRERYGQVTILAGARSPADLLYPDEYDAWRERDMDVVVTVDRADDGWRGHVGVVPMMFYQLRPDPQRTFVFSCGPEIMMRFVIYEALARRIPKEDIYLSLERNMKCAVGFCGHCQYGPFFLCKEGPVLSFDRVEPFFGVEEF
ncbi:MAG TPA: FAD/NAD(P)-binding protein [Anaerolineae bacterium]|nr:FAD/NAD(P)-binding protein [Anaerolineae bacterium]